VIGFREPNLLQAELAYDISSCFIPSYRFMLLMLTIASFVSSEGPQAWNVGQTVEFLLATREPDILASRWF
jgi:hypothetical protein